MVSWAPSSSHEAAPPLQPVLAASVPSSRNSRVGWVSASTLVTASVVATWITSQLPISACSRSRAMKDSRTDSGPVRTRVVSVTSAASTACSAPVKAASASMSAGSQPRSVEIN